MQSLAISIKALIGALQFGKCEFSRRFTELQAVEKTVLKLKKEGHSEDEIENVLRRLYY